MSTFLLIFIQALALLVFCNSEKIRFFATERAVISWYDPKHLKYVNATSRRFSRRDPFYYLDMNFDWAYEFHNNVTLNFYFLEFLTNRYARSFVEMHWKACDLVSKDKIFGTALRQGRLNRPCPFPAGPYHMRNMTIPMKSIPVNFPFKKGRISCNVTKTVGGALLASGHIDFEIKEVRSNGVQRTWVDQKLDDKENPGSNPNCGSQKC